MTNLERLKAFLIGEEPEGLEVERLTGIQSLRELESGECLMVYRKRLESIIEDLEELEERRRNDPPKESQEQEGSETQESDTQANPREEV